MAKVRRRNKKLAGMSLLEWRRYIQGSLDKKTDKELKSIFNAYSFKLPRGSSVFITFDGPGGSGKRTLIGALSNKISVAEGNNPPLKVDVFKDSDVGRFKNAIKEYRQEGGITCKDPTILAHLFTANRKYVLQSGTLSQKLEEYDTVLGDRYFLATFIRQLSEGQNPYDILELVRNSYILPDLSVIVYCDAEIASKRRTIRTGRELGSVDLQRTNREIGLYRSYAPLLGNSIEIDTSSTGVLPPGQELENAIKPFVEKIYSQYLAVRAKNAERML